MEKYMSLNEIKKMTKGKFKKLLTSKGYIVLDYPGEYRLIIPTISEKDFQYVCQTYGASANYFPNKKLGIISNWGCNDSMYEFQEKKEKKDTLKILEEIQQRYKASMKTCGSLKIITIPEIPEKKFRKLLVKYDCYCITYKTQIHTGMIIL